MNEGFIKLFRSLTEWEWYDNINVKVLFIHLLLKANFQDKKWRGIEIKKGEYLTSRDNLSKEVGLSVMQIRTCLKKLKLTGEITIKTTSSFTLIKLNNYSKYNGDNQQNNQQTTNKQPASNQQVTTTKERKEYKKEKNNILTSKGTDLKKSDTPKNFKDLLKTYFDINFLENIKNKYSIDSETLKNETELFVIHWTEKSENGKKELWEMQKTFDIQRRFYKWLANNKKWNKASNNNLNTNKRITYG